jgi:hypothetical protein
MATPPQRRKTREPKSVSSTGEENAARAFAVVLEDLRAQFNVFGEALQAHREETQRGDARARLRR